MQKQPLLSAWGGVHVLQSLSLLCCCWPAGRTSSLRCPSTSQSKRCLHCMCKAALLHHWNEPKKQLRTLMTQAYVVSGPLLSPAARWLQTTHLILVVNLRRHFWQISGTHKAWPTDTSYRHASKIFLLQPFLSGTSTGEGRLDSAGRRCRFFAHIGLTWRALRHAWL